MEEIFQPRNRLIAAEDALQSLVQPLPLMPCWDLEVAKDPLVVEGILNLDQLVDMRDIM